MSKTKKTKKLHLEMTRRNIELVTEAIDQYNSNTERVTPEIKFDHVINEAINSYLKKRGY